MTPEKRVAIAEDDNETAQFLERIARGLGCRCQIYTRGDALLKQLTRETYDLLLLDWNMPGKSGIEVLGWTQANLKPSPPVILITSRTEKTDISTALDAGADDYIIKPEAANVIAARIKAVLRRAAPEQKDERYIIFDRYKFDKMLGTVNLDDRAIPLTSKEFALAMMFFNNRNRPISRSYILETIWNSVGDLPTRTLDMHVSRIRAKLELKPENGFRLSTIFGYGYRLENYGDDISV